MDDDDASPVFQEAAAATSPGQESVMTAVSAGAAGSGSNRKRSSCSVGDDLLQPPASPTPVKRQAKAASRKSMLNIIRRQSKSMAGGGGAGGIAFEDQIAAVSADQARPAEERLRSLLRVALSATAAGVRETLRLEEADQAEKDAAEEVASHLRKTALPEALPEGALQGFAAGIGALDKAGAADSFLLLPSRVRSIRTYERELHLETEAWKRLLAERKEEYKRVRAHKQAVASGERKLTLADLPGGGADDPLLGPGLARGLLAGLREQERDLQFVEEELGGRLKRVRGRVAEGAAEMDCSVRKVAARSAELNVAETGESVSSKGKFAGEVDLWLREVERGREAAPPQQ